MSVFYINAECIACGSCTRVCPVDIIEQEGQFYAIDEEECVGCGACQVMCPVEAINEKY